MNIFVLATAARNSGALTIFKQFLKTLPEFIGNNKYYIFVSPEMCFEVMENVIYIPVSTHTWKKRILWEEFGLKNWIKEKKIEPDLIISFQNTGVNYKKVLQLIYYHQPLPLMKYKWNFFKKKERPFFLYKFFYPLFVKHYISPTTQFVVQTPYIKTKFIQRYKVQSSNVHVIHPDVLKVEFNKIAPLFVDSEYVHFIYPSTPIIYKNHTIIVRALDIIKKSAPEYLEKIKIHFTFNSEDEKDLYKDIIRKGLENNFIFEGNIPFDKLLSLYKSMSGLLFPSYIETYGMPLVEVSSFGIPIIVADLPYARDVVNDYKGVNFVDFNDSEGWARSILDICQNRPHYQPLPYLNESNWSTFFALVDNLLKNKDNV